MRNYFLAALILFVAQPLSAQSCDRNCLRGMVDQYLAALVKHDARALPLAVNVRFTENSEEKPLGEGLWKTASGLGTFRQDILDVRQGVAGTHTVVLENGQPALFLTRLKIAGGKITEIETMVVRNAAEGAIFQPGNLKTASAALAKVPARDQLNTREEAIRIALTYPEGLRLGSFVKANTPFAADAYRFENGSLMAGPTCTQRAGCNDIKTQNIPTLAEIKSRVVAVDEELGVVWLRMDFGRSPARQGNEGLVVWETFKVYGGQIHAVEAIMKLMPLGSKSGWE